MSIKNDEGLEHTQNWPMMFYKKDNREPVKKLSYKIRNSMDRRNGRFDTSEMTAQEYTNCVLKTVPRDGQKSAGREEVWCHTVEGQTA